MNAKLDIVDPGLVRKLIAERETAIQKGLRPCLLWVRVSTTLEEQEKSRVDQVRKAGEYCKAHGLHPCHVWAIRETGSKQAKRKSFQELMKILRTEFIGIRVVVAKNRKRIARNPADYNELLNLTKNTGLEIHYYQDNSIDSPLSRATDRMTARILNAVDSYEPEHLADEMVDAYRDKAERGIPPSNQQPLGYRWNKNQREICPEFENVVRRLFDEFDSGKYSIAAFVDWANRNGLKGRKGADWHKGSMEKFLKRVDYVGQFLFKGKLYDATFPPYITRERYAKRLERLGGRQNGDPAPRDHLMRRFVVCSSCKRVWIPELRHGAHKSGVYVYYRHECKVTPVREMMKEQVFIEALNTLVESVRFREGLADEIKELFRQDLSDNQKLSRSLRAKAQAIITLNEARKQKNYLALLDGLIEKEEFQKHDRSFSAAIRAARAESERASINSERVFAEISKRIELMREFPQIYAGASNQNKLRIVRECASAMMYDHVEGTFRLQWAEPYSFLMEGSGLDPLVRHKDGFGFVLECAQERT